VNVNGTWTNGTTSTYNNSTVGPHGWSNITVYAYNNSGTGTLNSTSLSNNTQVANNVPVQSAIGNKEVTAGNWLNISINTTDADSDPLIYGTNATGTLTGYNYSWQPTESDVGTHYWYFNSSDNYGGVAIENITVTVKPIITFTPPTPINLTNTHGNFWINHTWESGLGNVTDSYNVSVNDIWTNGTITTYNNTTVLPHGWSNITVYAYNNSGTGTLNSTSLSNNTQVTNNVPVQTAIGDKTVTAGMLLTFNVSALDADNDTIIYGTNANGTLNTTTGEYSWLTTGSDNGTHMWYFNSSDSFGGSANETITITVNALNTVSGYVFDNFGLPLSGALVQNGSYQNITAISGYYSIADIPNGEYKFTYSKVGFDTEYFIFTLGGITMVNVNKTLYDTTPPNSVSSPNSTTGNFYINNTWVNPSDVDFNSTLFTYSNGTVLVNVVTPVNYLNTTGLSPHITQNISAETVDIYGNINEIYIWFNATIPNNVPVQTAIVDKTVTAGTQLTINITATDLDLDPIIYGTNATNGTFNPTTGEYSWLTTSSDVGTYVWSFNSSDSFGGVAEQTITVTVTAAVPTNYLPPSPVNLASTQGNFWINHIWQAGIGNITDSFNVSVNGIWTNGTSNTYNNSTVPPHGWSNITVYAYNASGTGTLNTTSISNNTQVINNVPVQTAIGDKTVTAGTLLTFNVSALDADNDTITYGTNATNGTLNPITGKYSWPTTGSDVGTYIWSFNSTDIYGGIDTETLTLTVKSMASYNVSGYVFDNFGSGLGDVLIQNGSNQTITSVSGSYSITNMSNGTYNFSYSKAGFNTDYLEITINGADNTSANKTIYDTTPPTGINNIAAASTPLIINWTWTDSSDPDLDHVEVYIDSAFKSNVAKGVEFYNASYFEPNSTHMISTRTVDNYGNVNSTWINDTAITPSVFTYVFNFLINTGTVSSFSNAQNADGAMATFAEVQAVGENKSNRTMNPVKTITNGTQNNTYNSSYLNNLDGLIDNMIPGVSGTSETIYLVSTAKTGLGGITYWNLNATSGTLATTTTNIRILQTANRNYVFRPGAQNNQQIGTPGSVPAGYGWASNIPINGITGAGVWNFQVRTTSTVSNRNGRILVYVYKYNATSGTNIFLFNITGTSNHLGGSSTTENITSVVQPSYTFNSTEYMKVEYWLNAITGTNGAVLTFEANTATPFVRYVRNNYSINSTYTFTETNSSSTWQSISIKDNSYGDSLANISILNATSGQWESILSSGFTGGVTPSQHVNTIKGASSNANNYDAGSGQIKIRHNWTGARFNNSLGIDLINVTVNYFVPGPYKLNVTTNTTDIPGASIHTLELRYNVSGDNFTLQLWNGSSWNNRTILNDTSLSSRNITLLPDEVIPYGTLPGNAGIINKYYSLVRYLDLNASAVQQGKLYLDYQRIYNN
jgi:hypothetical protein